MENGELYLRPIPRVRVASGRPVRGGIHRALSLSKLTWKNAPRGRVHAFGVRPLPPVRTLRVGLAAGSALRAPSLARRVGLGGLSYLKSPARSTSSVTWMRVVAETAGDCLPTVIVVS